MYKNFDAQTLNWLGLHKALELSLAPVVPDIVTLREDIIQDKESWYTAADITDALLSITLHVDDQD